MCYYQYKKIKVTHLGFDGSITYKSFPFNYFILFKTKSFFIINTPSFSAVAKTSYHQ